MLLSFNHIKKHLTQTSKTHDIAKIIKAHHFQGNPILFFFCRYNFFFRFPSTCLTNSLVIFYGFDQINQIIY